MGKGRSLFPDILVPHCGILADVFAQQRGALGRIKIKNSHSQRTEPLQPALKIAALSHYHRTEAKLPNQSTAVPARRQRGNYGQAAIAALAPRIAERISLAMQGWIRVLHAAVVTRADEFARGIKDRGSDGDASFGQPFAGFRQRHL